MKILVIDDNELNRKSAEVTIGTEHELRLAASYDEAMGALRASQESPYDVVMVDLNMPMSRHGGIMAERLYDPRALVPYGMVLALLAAGVGAKRVALVTMSNHHEDAMGAAVERLFHHRFVVNGVPVTFRHAREVYQSKEDCFAGLPHDKTFKDWRPALADNLDD